MNFPIKFGFEPDLRKCEGRTIERVELLPMEFGCTWDSAYAVRFTDGSRAFFAGHVGTGIMNPKLDGSVHTSQTTVLTSRIFTEDEYAAMQADRKRRDQQRREETERHEKHEYNRLAKKFGGDK